MTRTTVSFSRAAILSVALSLMGSSIAAAQTTASQGTPTTASQGAKTTLVWSADFARQVQGRHLILTTSDGRKYEGVFTVSPDSLDSAGSKTPVAVPFKQIVRIQIPTYRMRHLTWLGAAVGTGIGIALACANDRDCGEEGGWAAGGLVFGGIGAGAGAAIGAALNHTHRDDDMLFDANRRTTTIAFAPILSPTRKGAAVRLTWR